MSRNNISLAICSLILLLLILACDGTLHISGEVYDSENHSLKDASVRFSAPRDQRFSEQPDESNSCEVKTGVDGSFGCGLTHAPFSGVPLRLMVSKTGYKTYQADFTSDDAHRKMELNEKFRIVLEKDE